MVHHIVVGNDTVIARDTDAWSRVGLRLGAVVCVRFDFICIWVQLSCFQRCVVQVDAVVTYVLCNFSATPGFKVPVGGGGVEYRADKSAAPPHGVQERSEEPHPTNQIEHDTCCQQGN